MDGITKKIKRRRRRGRPYVYLPTVIPRVDTTNGSNHSNNPTTSIADELAKLAKLKDQGVITESEFLQMKQDLISRK